VRTACKAVSWLVASLLAACSGVAQRNAVAPGQPTAAQPTAPAAVAQPTAAGQPTAGDPRLVPDKELIKKGYHVVKRGDKLLYCRTQTTTGSMIPTTACLTESQARWLEQQNDQQAQDLRTQPRGGRNCPRGTANCSNGG
jgi:hypothetical protein